MPANNLINAARAYLGKPFRHQGRGPDYFDCVGLLVTAARDCGLEVVDRTGYPMDPNGELVPALRENLEPITGKPEPGDVLLMRFAKEPQHVGLWTGSTVIHCYSSVGRVVEHSLSGKWARRVVSVWRFREGD